MISNFLYEIDHGLVSVISSNYVFNASINYDMVSIK